MAPTYGDPVPLGGSFIVDFLVRDNSMATGEFPPVVAEGTNIAARRPTPRPNKRRRDEVRATLNSVFHELLELIKESALNASPDAWEAFWFESDHIQEWISLCETLGKLRDRLGMRDREGSNRASQDLLALLETRFPEAAEELHFMKAVVDGASRRAAEFQPVPEAQRNEDFEAAARFKFWGSCFNMCMITLGAHARAMLEVPADIIPRVLAIMREAAIEFNHATMQAAELRRSDDVQTGEVFPADAIGDDLEHAEELIRKYEEGRI